MCKRLLVFVLMFGLVSTAIGQVAGVDDPLDMADSSGDIKRIEAWVDEGDLNLTMTVYGVFAPSVEDTPAGMSNRYYYHWILDTDNNPDTGYLNDEYEGNATNLETPIGVDVLIQFGWRNGATDGVYAYTLDPLTGDEVELFADYEYTIDGDTIHAVIPLEDLGLELGQTIAVSAYQEGASNDWQVDWVESFELTLTAVAPVPETITVFFEDFEGLPLGPNVDEVLAGDAVWTDTPPAGWIIDESGIPGIGDPNTDGVTEWAGWAFADKAWWTQTAGDQDRSLFVLGSGAVAIADPDEWDDADHTDSASAGWYKTYLSSPAIDISGCRAGTVQLKFDSSWRPEFDDDYRQTANITASFDGAAPVVVLLWESDESSANYKPYATNETITVDLQNPKGAKSVVLTFGLYDAGNDWWWAIDNVEVSGKPLPEPVDPGTANLVNSWTFDDGTANDIVGNANGTLVGDAMVVDGQLVLDGNGDWMDMPGEVIAMNTFEGLTIEVQFTSVAGGNRGFHMVTAFGEEGTGANPGYGYKYVCITPARGDNVSRAMIQTVSMDNDPWNEETGVSDVIEHDDGLPHHMVCTIDNTELAFYIDGVLIGTAALDPPGNSIAGIGTAVARIGKGVYGVDPLWAGSVDYLNLYNRALSEGEVRYLAGYRADTGEDPSLVIYYSFDEVGAVVADQSGKGHDGVVVGDVTAEANGMYGGAAKLANTGYLDLDGANFPAEDIPTSGFTLAAWTNIDGTSSQNAIFNARASDSTWLIHPEIRPGNGDYRFTVRKYGGVTIGNINGGTPGYKQPEGTPVPNEWVHVAMTFSRVDAQVILYVNGQVVAQAAITEDADLAGDWGLGARVGYNIDDARHYTGLMDEFRMYKRALSHDEILVIMQGP